jgi:hypothetical protein
MSDSRGGLVRYLIAAALAAALGGASTAVACTSVCGPAPDGKSIFYAARVAYIARVVKVDLDKTDRGTAWLRVEEAYKGRLPKQVSAPTGPAEACEQPFLMGRRYLLFKQPSSSGEIEPPEACVDPESDIQINSELTMWVRRHQRVPIG